MQARAIALCWAPIFVLVSGCSSSLSAPDTPPETPAAKSTAEPTGAASFFDCDDLADCKDRCAKGLWDGCAGAYVHSDRSTPEREAAAKAYLEKGCALGGELACTMLEPNDPPVGPHGPHQIIDARN